MTPEHSSKPLEGGACLRKMEGGVGRHLSQRGEAPGPGGREGAWAGAGMKSIRPFSPGSEEGWGSWEEPGGLNGGGERGRERRKKIPRMVV